MSLTQTEALDKFCILHKYDLTKLQGETKAQFLSRKKKEWAISQVKEQVRRERFESAQVAINSDIDGLDI